MGVIHLALVRLPAVFTERLALNHFPTSTADHTSSKHNLLVSPSPSTYLLQPPIAVGLLALVVASIERNPHTPLFSRQNPYYSQLVCAAEFGTTIPPHIERLIEKSKTSDGALKALGAVLGKDRDTRTFVTTTQAIDLIEGGVKGKLLFGCGPPT